MLQVLIGGALTIAGGLGAAIWQTYRADDVAQRIRQAERREPALLDLSSEAAKATAQVNDVWQAARQRVLQGDLQGNTAKVSGDDYQPAIEAVRGLQARWDTELSGLLPDQAIEEGILACQRAAATRLWCRETVAYAQQPPMGGFLASQFIGDLEAVYLALADLRAVLRAPIQALQPRPPWRHRVLAWTRAKTKKSDDLSRSKS